MVVDVNLGITALKAVHIKNHVGLEHMHQKMKINSVITVGHVIQENIAVHTHYTNLKVTVLKDIIALLERS
jgi:4-hydroxy-L-threonine phosphate dehydrogenase PdxA